MKLAIGCDHGGFELKEEILKFIKTVSEYPGLRLRAGEQGFR